MNINDAMTAVYDKYGVFFAFSDKQYNDKAVDGVEYVSGGAGMVVPKEHATAVNTELNAAIDTHQAWKLETMGMNKIILDELHNHEAFYTYEIDDTVDALDGYGFTAADVQKVFNDNC